MGPQKDEILLAINDRLGDNNPRLRELSEQTMLDLSDDDGNEVVEAILELASKKTLNSVKHLITRAKLLGTLLQKCKPQIKGIGEYAVGLSTHPNKDVRNAAIELLLMIKKTNGSGASAPFSAKLKPA